VFFAAMFLLVSAANAAEYAFCSDTWYSGGCTCSGDPISPPPALTSDDTVNVCSGTWSIGSDINVAAIVVESGATMAMGANVETDTLTVYGTVTTGAYTLTITGASGLTITSTGLLDVNATNGAVDLTGGGTHTITPTNINLGLRLSATGAYLCISADTTISGTGYIEGRHNDAVILIDSTKTLVNEVVVQGALTVSASGATFQNDDTVLANYAASGTQDTLLFDAGTITGTGTGTFEVNTPGATMEFDATDVNATAIRGSLTISAGTLDCETDVAFLSPQSFSMTGTDSTINVAPGATFEAH
jgi:hypothetical protein